MQVQKQTYEGVLLQKDQQVKDAFKIKHAVEQEAEEVIINSDVSDIE